MYIRYIPTQKRKPVGDPNQVAFLGRRDFREFLEEVRSVPNHEHDWDKICFWAGLLQAKLRRRVAVVSSRQGRGIQSKKKLHMAQQAEEEAHAMTPRSVATRTKTMGTSPVSDLISPGSNAAGLTWLLAAGSLPQRLSVHPWPVGPKMPYNVLRLIQGFQFHWKFPLLGAGHEILSSAQRRPELAAPPRYR